MIIFHYLYKLTLIAICHYQSIGTGYCEVALFCHLSLSVQMINVSPWISLSTDDNVSPCISLSTDDNVSPCVPLSTDDNVSPCISLSTDNTVSPCISLSTDDNVLLSLY